MDLIGKTVRWEDPSGTDWFTALVVKRHRKPGLLGGAAWTARQRGDVSHPVVRVSSEAFQAAVNVGGTQRKLEAAAPIIVDEVVGELIAAFEGMESMRHTAGDPAARGVLDCVRHLRQYRRRLGVHPDSGAPQARSIPDTPAEAK